VEVALDEQVPLAARFQILNRPPIEIGQAVQIRLQGEDLSGIRQAAVGLINANEDPAQWKAETGKPMSVVGDPQSPTRFTAEAHVSTDRMAAGDYLAVVQLVDLAGNVAEPGTTGLAPLRVRLVMPDPKPTGPAVDPNYRGTVAGITFVGANKALGGIQVELKGGPQFAAQETPSSGQFRFAQVPLGKYTLEAKGKLNNRAEIEAKYEFQLEKPEDYRQNFNLKLQAKPPE
jgi:hypothetical protein